MGNEIKIFKNEQLNLQVRTIQNEDGSISVSAEDSAIGFGWYQIKGDKKYPKWERMNGFISEFGFSPQVGKDDYIPESLFYILGMKASNKVAQDFQKWLAVWVIPSIRKTGSYQIQEKPKKLSALEQLQLQNQAILEVNEKVDKIQNDMPLFKAECDELQTLVRKTGVNLMGGKNSPSYKDNSLRSRIYSDIQHQLRREFGVDKYAWIKHSQFNKAKEIVSDYELPIVLKDEITGINNQISFEQDTMEEIACTK